MTRKSGWYYESNRHALASKGIKTGTKVPIPMPLHPNTIAENEYKAKLKKMKKANYITIIGRRWFDRINGNTYHSVEVFVDSKYIGKNDFEYGYGDHYLVSAMKILETEGYLPHTGKMLTSGADLDGYMFRREMMEHPDRFIKSVSDVGRKGDL